MPALAPPGASVLEISPTPPLYLPYISQVHMSVLESSRRAPGVYERKVMMHARGEEIMQVCWSGVLARSPPQPQSQPPASPCSPPIVTHPHLALRPSHRAGAQHGVHH